MNAWKPAVIAFCAGLLGVLVALGGWTVYQDHVLVRTLAQIEAARERAPVPAPPVSAPIPPPAEAKR